LACIDVIKSHLISKILPKVLWTILESEVYFQYETVMTFGHKEG